MNSPLQKDNIPELRCTKDAKPLSLNRKAIFLAMGMGALVSTSCIKTYTVKPSSENCEQLKKDLVRFLSLNLPTQKEKKILMTKKSIAHLGLLASDEVVESLSLKLDYNPNLLKDLGQLILSGEIFPNSRIEPLPFGLVISSPFGRDYILHEHGIFLLSDDYKKYKKALVNFRKEALPIRKKMQRMSLLFVGKVSLSTNTRVSDVFMDLQTQISSLFLKHKLNQYTTFKCTSVANGNEYVYITISNNFKSRSGKETLERPKPGKRLDTTTINTDLDKKSYFINTRIAGHPTSSFEAIYKYSYAKGGRGRQTKLTKLTLFDLDKNGRPKCRFTKNFSKNPKVPIISTGCYLNGAYIPSYKDYKSNNKDASHQNYWEKYLENVDVNTSNYEQLYHLTKDLPDHYLNQLIKQGVKLYKINEKKADIERRHSISIHLDKLPFFYWSKWLGEIALMPFNPRSASKYLDLLDVELTKYRGRLKDKVLGHIYIKFIKPKKNIKKIIRGQYLDLSKTIIFFLNDSEFSDISFNKFDLISTIHHEIFHAIQNSGDKFESEKWVSKTYKSNPKYQPYGFTAKRTMGFSSGYSARNPVEDSAETYSNEISPGFRGRFYENMTNDIITCNGTLLRKAMYVREIIRKKLGLSYEQINKKKTN